MKIGPGVSELWGGVENRPLPTDLTHRLYNSLYYRISRDYYYYYVRSRPNDGDGGIGNYFA